MTVNNDDTPRFKIDLFKEGMKMLWKKRMNKVMEPPKDQKMKKQVNLGQELKKAVEPKPKAKPKK